MHCVNDMDNRCKETLVYLIVIFRYDTIYRALPIDEIDDRKINRSIDGNRLRLVNWHRLASANR